MPQSGNTNMNWNELSMGERLHLLKDRRTSNPTYSYFDLRAEYDVGEDPYSNPAQYNYTQPKFPNVDYDMPIQATQMPNIPKIEQVVTSNLADNSSPLKAIDYTQYLPSAQEYNEKNWSLPTYDNTKYSPSSNIRNQISQWEGSSMRTNAPIETKAKELKNLLGFDLMNHLSQDQMDSLTSYYYNIMPSSFLPTLKQLKQLPNVKTKDEYDNLLHNVSKTINVGYNRKGMSGLTKRRIQEQNLFLYGH